MAYDKQLFIGKLSSVTPKFDNVVAFTGDVLTGDRDIENIANYNATFDISLLRVGQIINTFGLGFATNVIITNISGTTLTVDTPANATGTTQTFAADTPVGTYFISSASFSDPQNIINVNDVTGSLDTDYNKELSPKYAILAAASSTLTDNAITGKFHNYVITDVPYRNPSIGEISVFVSWGEAGIESDSGEVMYQGSDQTLAIGAMSVTSSQISTFDPSIITGLDPGANVGPYQITLPAVIDKTGSGDTFPYTGSAEISGSLAVTGSNTFLLNNGNEFKIQSIKGNPTLDLLNVNGDTNVINFHAYGNADVKPAAVLGGIYFTSASLFIGIE